MTLALTVLAHPMLVDGDKTKVFVMVTNPGGYANAKNRADLCHYFEYSKEGIAFDEDSGLKEISFGEYLVDQGLLDRYQLFRALQMQDRLPGVRLGEAVAALGYAPIGVIERVFKRFQELSTIDID